mmetsp:Transcript_38339/g.106548  ORF Transcript_38339/g.106548 Transcript_38339/m.106548 type:complete len:166 (+) Transcript_38339:465-962(+)
MAVCLASQEALFLTGAELVPARSLALSDACVQASEGWSDTEIRVSPVGVARLLLAKMRASMPYMHPSAQLALGAWDIRSAPVSYEHLIFRDAVVAGRSPVRFDPQLQLMDVCDDACARTAVHVRGAWDSTGGHERQVLEQVRFRQADPQLLDAHGIMARKPRKLA